jgi:O-antigen ligase
MEFVHSRRRGAIALTTAVLAMVSYVALDVIIAALPDNRMVQLFDLSENTSWESRNELLDQALSTIASNPLLGDYGSYAKVATFTGAGDYAHNILSAWVDLGLPGFVYLCLLLAVPLFRIGVCAFAQHRDPLFLTAFSLIVFSSLLLVVAKDFTYLPIAAALGAYANFEGSLLSMQPTRHRSPHSEL